MKTIMHKMYMHEYISYPTHKWGQDMWIGFPCMCNKIAQCGESD